MKTLIRDSGVRITYPDSFRIAAEKGARRGRVRLPQGPISMPRATVDDTTQTGALSAIHQRANCHDLDRHQARVE